MDDRFIKDYPKIFDVILDLYNRVNELEYQNILLKQELKQYKKAELANGATRKFINDNMFVINYMDKYLRDIGAI